MNRCYHRGMVEAKDNPFADKQSGKPTFIVPGINLTNISTHTGLSIAHTSRIFSGKRLPSYTVFRKLAQFLKVSEEKLSRMLEERPWENE